MRVLVSTFLWLALRSGTCTLRLHRSRHEAPTGRATLRLLLGYSVVRGEGGVKVRARLCRKHPDQAPAVCFVAELP